VQQRDGVELSAADIRAYCADQITHFKVPSIVRFVDEFPMTVTWEDSKVQNARCHRRRVDG
jgi:fatty-acyl-CoA synthase